MLHQFAQGKGVVSVFESFSSPFLTYWVSPLSVLMLYSLNNEYFQVNLTDSFHGFKGRAVYNSSHPSTDLCVTGLKVCLNLHETSECIGSAQRIQKASYQCHFQNSNCHDSLVPPGIRFWMMQEVLSPAELRSCLGIESQSMSVHGCYQHKLERKKMDNNIYMGWQNFWDQL